MDTLDNLLGLLKIKVKRGINLVIRDFRSSDPYCVFKMGEQVIPHFQFQLVFICEWILKP
ncbi:putative C2 domain superfamily, protein C2-DOMAIN ABA-related protein [Helianthus debilis subsp. tardiflorus]